MMIDIIETENGHQALFSLKSSCPKCVLLTAKVQCQECKTSNFCSKKCADEHRGSSRCKAMAKVTEIFQNAKKAESTAQIFREKLTLFSGGSRIFPRGGREPSRGGVNTPNFPENCMKSKEFGRPGGACVPHAPPRSANAIGL